MKSLMPLALSVLLLAVAARPLPAITFGEVDNDNLFPNVGAIVVIKNPTGVDRPVPRAGCSGTLIHPRVLLTAGHCMHSLEAAIADGIATLDNVRVSFGTDAFDETTWLEIEAVVTHPDFAFTPVNDQHDVGLVILKEPVDLPCATLAYAGFLDDLKAAGLLVNGGDFASFLAAGYGTTLNFPPPEVVAADGQRRFVFTQYVALQNAWLVMNQNQAIGEDNGGTGFGDSGGPRFWVAPDGSLVLVAVTSRGDPKLVALDQAYRIDTVDALGFIEVVLSMVD